MLLDFTTVVRRTLVGLVWVTTLAGARQSLATESFEAFLNSAQAINIDEPLGDPIAEPIDVEPATPQGMIEEATQDTPGNEPDLSDDEPNVEKSDSEKTNADGEKQEEDKDATDKGDQDKDEENSDISKLTNKIKELEKEMSSLSDSLEKVEDIASNKSIVVSGTSKSTMKITGRIHVDAWGFDTDDNPGINQFNGGDDPENRLGFRRIRYAVQGKIQDNMIYKLETELSGAPDVEFRDMFIGWIDLPVLGEVLLGNQKRPFGLDHLNSSRHNVFIERPFIVEAFNEDARRLGLQAYGVSDDMDWNWRYGVFNQRNIQDEVNYVGDHLQLQLAGRLANTFWFDQTSNGRGYGHWAISGTHADVSENAAEGSLARFRTRPEARTESTRWLDTGTIDGAEYYNVIGFEGVVNVGAVQVVGEYQSNWIERPGMETVHLDGGYVYLSYFLTGEFIPWDRESGTIDRVVPLQNFWMVDTADGGREAGWGALQVAARYSQADFSDQDIFGGRGEALTLAMNWFWNANAKMQFNYITGKISNSDVGDRGADPVNGEYDIYGARFIVDF